MDQLTKKRLDEVCQLQPNGEVILIGPDKGTEIVQLDQTMYVSKIKTVSDDPVKFSCDEMIKIKH